MDKYFIETLNKAYFMQCLHFCECYKSIYMRYWTLNVSACWSDRRPANLWSCSQLHRTVWIPCTNPVSIILWSWQWCNNAWQIILANDHTLVAPKTAASLSWTLVDHCGAPQRATPKPRQFSRCVLPVNCFVPPFILLTPHPPSPHPCLRVYSPPSPSSHHVLPGFCCHLVALHLANICFKSLSLGIVKVFASSEKIGSKPNQYFLDGTQTFRLCQPVGWLGSHHAPPSHLTGNLFYLFLFLIDFHIFVCESIF